MTTWTVQATVGRCIDGDTFSCDLDLGWGVWRREVLGAPSRVRILGLDTPERGQLGYVEARSALEALLPFGLIVWVISQRLDSFGRALADVVLLDGRSVRALMPEMWWV
jgi:micrococcal nuclease